MAVEETPGYRKTSIKTMFYSYHMEQKIFIEVRHNNNIHTGEEVPCSCCF